ncbi:MAG TPA: hypothetical protein VFZ65_18520 [Planctomycetota bacterium]|nr:hypothetical protein [Planctomycetota bacterium]
MSALGSFRLLLATTLAGCAASSPEPEPASEGPFAGAVAAEVEVFGVGRALITEPAEVARIAACFAQPRPGYCNIGSGRFQVAFEHAGGGLATVLATPSAWETYGEPAWSGCLCAGSEQVLEAAVRTTGERTPPPTPAAAPTDARLLMDPIVGDVFAVTLPQPSNTWPWPHR